MGEKKRKREEDQDKQANHEEEVVDISSSDSEETVELTQEHIRTYNKDYADQSNKKPHENINNALPEESQEDVS